jgi:MFS family permease
LSRESCATRLRPVLTAIGSISVVGLTTGVTLPLVSLRLAQAHASASDIALLAALPALGTLLVALILRPASQALGPRTLLLIALILSCASVPTLALRYAPLPWALSRLAMGVATGILFALGEARILEAASDRQRGRWTGLYATTLTACQLAGPGLLALLGPNSSVPLAIAAAMHLLAMLLIASDSAWQADQGRTPLALGALLRASLPLAVAVLFFAMFDSTVLSLLPLYGLALGIPARVAVLMVSVVLLGDTSLQIPLGWCADRLGRRRVHAACGVLTVCAAAALHALQGLPVAFWAALFVMGGAAGSLYTLAIVGLGDRYRGAQLLSANAFVGFLWGIGGLTGPLLGSAAMQCLRPYGLMLFVTAAATLFLLSLLIPTAAAQRP